MAKSELGKKFLQRLRKGQEVNWDYIPSLVSDGDISRTEAIYALLPCLVINIPRYTIYFARGRHRYWISRLDEAVGALGAIFTGRTVTYRGHEV